MTPEHALKSWAGDATPTPCADGGLINQTWLVGDPPGAVLQRVNAIFSPLVNRDIAAWTARLRARGILSPEVLPTRDGGLWVEDPEGGCWRMLSYIPGRTLHRLTSPQQAAAVGGLVGRVHRALDGWTPPRHAPLRRIHDSPARMADLARALEAGDGHPLEAQARALGGQILADWQSWEGPDGVPERICHGDLKISNLRFDASGHQALCLIDLDTVGPMDLPSEMGDAWRSWCNPAGEDDPTGVSFDQALFSASAEAFLSQGPELAPAEREGLAPAVERICLELSARFCADALNNCYFREDRARFPAVGAHNLHRAQVQHQLARSARRARSFCEQVVQRYA